MQLSSLTGSYVGSLTGTIFSVIFALYKLIPQVGLDHWVGQVWSVGRMFDSLSKTDEMDCYCLLNNTISSLFQDEYCIKKKTDHLQRDEGSLMFKPGTETLLSFAKTPNISSAEQQNRQIQ